jgi:hypothetical protein
MNIVFQKEKKKKKKEKTSIEALWLSDLFIFYKSVKLSMNRLWHYFKIKTA